jgi:hypothetical protein
MYNMYNQPKSTGGFGKKQKKKKKTPQIKPWYLPKTPKVPDSRGAAEPWSRPGINSESKARKQKLSFPIQTCVPAPSLP